MKRETPPTRHLHLHPHPPTHMHLPHSCPLLGLVTHTATHFSTAVAGRFVTSPHLTSPHPTTCNATQRGNHRTTSATNQPTNLSPFFLCLVFVRSFVRSFIPSSLRALVCYEYSLASLAGCDGLPDLLCLLCRRTSRPRTLHTSVCVDCVSRNNWSFLEGWLNLDQRGVDKRLRMKLTTPA